MTKNQYAQQIAELLCKRFFRTKGYNTLPLKFWNDERFARDFKLQKIKAFSLLKIYDGQVIMNVLTLYKYKNIYSLNCKFLDPVFAQEQEKLNRLKEKVAAAAEKQEAEIVLDVPSGTDRPAFTTKESILDKLD
jgi:hypothetical protein